MYGEKLNYGMKRLLEDGGHLPRSSGVASINRPPEVTLHDLIQRVEHSNDRAFERAAMAERLADLLCGNVPTGDALGEAIAPVDLLSQMEYSIDRGDQISARVDAALHRIARRLKPPEASA